MLILIIIEVRMVMWEALQLCHKEGKIKHIGVSNFARKHIEGLVKDPRYIRGIDRSFRFKKFVILIIIYTDAR